jgi:hypothetical protein
MQYGEGSLSRQFGIAGASLVANPALILDQFHTHEKISVF